MTKFVPGGPPRFDHQRGGLQKMIATGGVTALLFDPGMGKTAVVIDYASLLALKLGEARVLVVCPLVAIDTWVLQAELFMSPQVGYWAEALGGSLLERAETLASRGDNAYSIPLSRRRPTPPRGLIRTDVLGDGRHRAGCLRCGVLKTAARSATVDRWWQQHLTEHHPERLSAALRHAPRALHHGLALAHAARQPEGCEWPLSASQGPEGVEHPRVVLEVINIDTLASRATFGSRTMADVMVGAIKRFEPDLVVIDESHKIKSPRGNASTLLARVAPFVRRRMLLTGTVMPAGPLDVFAQWRFLDPYAFGEHAEDGTRTIATFQDFKDRYVEYGGWGYREIKGYLNLDEMQQIMARNSVVARKAEALDLPPTTEIVLPVKLSPAEASAYVEMKRQLVTTLVGGGQTSAGNRLTQMLRLRQITSGHLPEDRGPVRVIGTSKVDMIRSLVEDTLVGEKRIVIFALFTHEIAQLAVALRKSQKSDVMVIEGSTDVEDRRAMRTAFGDLETNPHRIVMIAQIKTMSLAVNELVTANHAVFASLSQQRDDLVQAKDRLNRIGQTKPVTFWYCLAPGTVDEVILRSHRERTSLEDALLQHIADGE